MLINVGMTGHAEDVVTPANTADAVGSGMLPVYATPSMIALMERAAVCTVEEGLEDGETTVGTHLNVSHDEATPQGLKVWAEAEVTAVYGRKITFFVRAFDETGPIGGGVHERCIVGADRFFSKAAQKKEAESKLDQLQSPSAN